MLISFHLGDLTTSNWNCATALRAAKSVRSLPMSEIKRQKTAEGFAAIAFDIDGVFKYGRDWSPDGLVALQKCTEAGIPFVFVTNGGGGLTEATYAAQACLDSGLALRPCPRMLRGASLAQAC